MIPFTTVFSQFNDKQGFVNFSNPMPVHDFIKCAETNGLSDRLLDRYFFSNLLKKSPYLADVDTSDATLIDFFDAEKHASRYNELFYQLAEHPRMSKYLSIWRDQVRLIMGKPRLNKFTITHGATNNCATGQNPVERFKFAQVTSELNHYIDGRAHYKEVIPCDEWTIGVGVAEEVPKTWKIGRLIVKPCAINALFQKASGNALKESLLREGIDLSIAQEQHRRLARFASIKGHLTTDDQKWASILVYTSLVRHLVDPDWYEVLNAQRDHRINFKDGTSMELAQFATMGNGFCFELETIIFLGLLRTAAYIHGVPIRHKDIRVFGDDLIYPVELTETVRAIGRNVGFICNIDKSFSEGAFRESCGGDYYNGIDVRPVHLKGNFDDAFDLIVMCNQLEELLQKHEWELPSIRKVYFKLVQRLYSKVGRKNVPWGPRNMAGCLHGRPLLRCVQEVNPKTNLMYFQTYVKKPLKLESFREIAYGTNPDYLLRMITAGYMQGAGSIVKVEKLRHWIFGPPKPPTAIYPRVVPVAGTAYKTVRVSQPWYQKTPLFDQNRPLDIFKFLGMTKCLPHIYDKNYVKASEGYKHLLVQELLIQIQRLRETKITKLTNLGDLVIDI